MKRFFRMLSVMACLMLVACDNFDHDGMIDRIENLEDRVYRLETLCSQMNTNINSLQTIVQVLQTGDYITAVSPLVEEGVEVGYSIVFAKAGSIVIYHGRNGQDGTDGKDGQNGADGADGKDMIISVKQDEDGIWYWVLNGEWLLDENGNKVKAAGLDGKDGQNGENGKDGQNGADGKDGITPQLRIENEYWEVSYDGGQTWLPLHCKATGEDGAPAQVDVIFENVYEEDGCMVFVLKDGSTYRIPYAANGLDIIFSVNQGTALCPGTYIKVAYTVVGNEGEVWVRSLSSPLDLLMAVVEPTDNTTGYIHIAHSSIWESLEDESLNLGGTQVDMADYINTNYAINVSVSDAEGNAIIKALNLQRGTIESVSDVYMASAEGGVLEVSLETNLDDYEVVQQEGTESWLTLNPDTKSMRTDILRFNVQKNETALTRTAVIAIQNQAMQTMGVFTIVQPSTMGDSIIAFADEAVKEACVFSFDANGDGELSYNEAAMVTSVDGLFYSGMDIKSFDEFQYFVSVKEVPGYMFQECDSLQSVSLPASILRIGESAFEDCSALEYLEIPAFVQHFGDNVFGSCRNLKTLKMNPLLPPVIDGWLAFDLPLLQVFVPDQALERYESDAMWSSYKLVSDVWLACEPSIDYSIEKVSKDSGDDNRIFFKMNVSIVGGKPSLPAAYQEYGFYVRNYPSWDSYIDEMVSMNEESSISGWFGLSKDDLWYQPLELSIGFYVMTEEGDIVCFEDKDIVFSYDEDTIGAEDCSPKLN